MWCYRDNGAGAVLVADDYVAQAGEAVFDHFPAATAELQVVWPDYAEPRICPTPISPRQFYIGLADEGEITQAEALAAIKGTIPAALLSLIEQLPEANQFPAKMKITGAVEFERDDTLTEAIRVLYEWTPEQTDTFWTACAAL